MTKRTKRVFLSLIILMGIFTGCAMVGVKQLGRNNMTEENIAKIIPCRTTKLEVQQMFRLPSGDYHLKNGDYDIYILKGFGGRAQFETRTLQLMFNKYDVVVDKNLADDEGISLSDQCL